MLQVIGPLAFSVGIVTAIVACIAVSCILGLKGLRLYASRQWFGIFGILSSGFFAFLAVASRPSDMEQQITAALFLAFGLGWSISTMRGPFRVPGVIAALLGSLLVLLILFICTASLNIVIFEYRSRPKFLGPMTLVLVFLLSIPGIYWMFSWQAKQQLFYASRVCDKDGLCPSCNYDLRGSVGKTHCPECGEAIDWEKVVISEHA